MLSHSFMIRYASVKKNTAAHQPAAPSPPSTLRPPPQESRNLLEYMREASSPRGLYRPGLSRYNTVLQQLRNAPARGGPGTTLAAGAAAAAAGEPGGTTYPRSGDGGDGGSRAGEDPAGLEGGGKRSGAEGWTKGHVAGYLEDMRSAGVTPDVETYQCAIRCATDAAVLDIMKAGDAAAAAAAEAEAVE